MTVTAVLPRRKSLCALYIDGEYALNLDKSVLAENCVREGMCLTDEKLHSLIIQSDEKRAKERALYLLSYRSHTKKELYTKLQRDFSEDLSLSVCERMEELGLLDDEAFAKRYANDLLTVKRLSKHAALYKMLEKGLDRELCEFCLEEANIDPCEQIAQIIEKKYAKTLGTENGVKKTVAALLRKGYSYSDVRCVISQFCEDWTD